MTRLLAATLLALAVIAAPADPAREKRIRLISVGGDEHRIYALDASGRLIAHGDGRGTTSAVSACPGGDVIAEQVYLRGTTEGVSVRTLEDMRASPVVRVPDSLAIYRMKCLARDGSRVAVILGDGTPDPAKPVAPVVMLIEKGRRKTLARLNEKDPPNGAIRGGRLYIGSDIVDLDTGRVTEFKRLPDGALPYAFSPDGSLLLGSRDDELIVLDARTGKEKASTAQRFDSAMWLGNDRVVLAYERRGFGTRVKFLTAGLEFVRSVAGTDRPAFADGRRLVTTDDFGKLVRYDRNGKVASRSGRITGFYLVAVVP